MLTIYPKGRESERYKKILLNWKLNLEIQNRESENAWGWTLGEYWDVSALPPVGGYAREAIHTRQHNGRGEIEWFTLGPRHKTWLGRIPSISYRILIFRLLQILGFINVLVNHSLEAKITDKVCESLQSKLYNHTCVYMNNPIHR